ncbi:hypothetical protein B9G53_22640 [Pseudanabaena sp. SR411]|uniref:hypothetical protein n=1 Tax=Pseudanabaena sp. SR411 TaxID=1980935 RepID=UPI000B98BDCE|nr:hypothetical protein [Pseudanabaena sp. SR411]OYQ62327.1 hypothetical protein B9G53_22640 [Pseudanabaena sp. SR411]
MLISCESKVSQCGKLQQVIAKEKTLSTSANPDALADLATKLDGVTAELESVKIGDGNLQNSQKNLVGSYKNLAQSVRNVTTEIDKAEVKSIKTSLNSLERVTEEKQSFVNEINNYCAIQ